MLKKIIKHILFVLHLDITQNQKYDRQTIQIMKSVIQPEFNCIDIGCHKGEMLDEILKYAPDGTHFAFEPIPDFFDNLKEKYKHNLITVFSFALSDSQGLVTFNFVKNAPAYSGIKQRKYAISNPDIATINVKTELLDNVIPIHTKIDFIKIDVEGAEFMVLKGAVKTLSKWKPIIIFECGLGASDCYGTKPEDLYDLIISIGLKISLMTDFLSQKPSLTQAEFCKNYNEKLNYYFIAHP